ncbi:MAG: chemotaxis protein CheD [Phycisphaerae bacterium]|nr:chemotaxis protein CheD [Phycisphaerae bacterium]
MKHIVGIADMKISSEPGDIVVTHALGSCLGISAYDPIKHVGGIVHVMMPTSTLNPEKAKANPYMFIDTGIPAFFRELYGAGGVKRQIVVKVAGGANVHNASGDRFAIGKKNFIMLRKIFWKNGVLIESADVGGTCARTMYLDMSNGRVWLNSAGKDKEL